MSSCVKCSLSLLHPKQVIHHFDKVVRCEKRIVNPVLLRPAHLDVELQTPDA